MGVFVLTDDYSNPQNFAHNLIVTFLAENIEYATYSKEG